MAWTRLHRWRKRGEDSIAAQAQAAAAADGAADEPGLSGASTPPASVAKATSGRGLAMDWEAPSCGFQNSLHRIG